MTASVGGADDSDSVDSASLEDSFGDALEATSQSWNGRDIQLQNQKHHKHALISQFYVNVLREVKEIEHAQVGERRYDILDFTQDKIEELASDFDSHLESSPLLALHHPSLREFALADPIRFQVEIAQCRSLLKRLGKAIEHGYKKAEKKVKRICKEVGKGVVEVGKGVAKVAEKVFDTFAAAPDAIAHAGKAVGKAVEKGAKEVVHFVKEHKTEVLVGVAVVAVVTGLILIAEEAIKAAAALKAAEALAAAAAAGSLRRGNNHDTIANSEITPGTATLSSAGLTSPDPDNSWMTKSLGDQPTFNTSKAPLDQNPAFLANGSPYQKMSDELMEFHASRVYDTDSQFSSSPPKINTHFQTAFASLMDNLEQADANTNGSFEPAGNPPALVSFLETLGKTAMNTAAEVPVSNTGNFQRTTGFLQSIGLGDAYSNFLQSLGEGIDKVADSLPSPAQFLQIISGLMGFLPTAQEEHSNVLARSDNTLNSQLGLLNPSIALDNGETIPPEETISRLRSALGPLTEILQKSSGMAGLVFNPTEESLIATNGFGNGKIKAPDEITSPVQSASASFLETLGKGIDEFRPNLSSPSVFLHNISSPAQKFAVPLKPSNLPHESCYIKIEGSNRQGMQRGFINGMNTKYEEGIGHTGHIKNLADGASIEWFYNHSNSWPVDLGEIFLLSYSGFSPKSADVISKQLIQFHVENENNPHAKYLMFTHSMGNIIMKNVLLKLPQEIRDRVIVVAIAPAVIIPEGLCYRSHHYASKKDIVHRGEDFSTFFGASFVDEEVRKEMLKQLIENKEQLILLDPHPSVTGIGIDHGLQSPTFASIIKWHNEDYEKHKGQY